MVLGITKLLKIKGTWQDVMDSAYRTIGIENVSRIPDSIWKKRMLLAEHSPIRKLIFNWKWSAIKYWVSVHFVRHKFGIEHWVSTQRSDRVGVDRDDIGQGGLVIHECEANAQAIINMSRKRLCKQASKETREAWQAFLFKIKLVEPEVFAACVPDCVYRGHCYEFKSCGHHKTEEYQEQLRAYREGINE